MGWGYVIGVQGQLLKKAVMGFLILFLLFFLESGKW